MKNNLVYLDLREHFGSSLISYDKGFFEYKVLENWRGLPFIVENTESSVKPISSLKLFIRYYLTLLVNIVD